MTDLSFPQFPPQERTDKIHSQRSKWNYLGLGLLANTLIWGAALAYITLSPKEYKSEFGVKVLTTASDVDVTLPDGLRTSPSSNNSGSAADSRSDYVYLLNSKALKKEAAAQVGMTVADYGDLEVTTNPDSSIIELVVEGESPELAQEKARAMYAALDQTIEDLRKSEVARRERGTREDVDSARLQVTEAQKKLSGYQASSGLNSDSQIDNLASGIEQLRQQYAQALAQERGLDGRVRQLATDINDSSAGAGDAYSLQGDPVYQSQFVEYGSAAAEYADISSQLGDQHPQVVAKRAEVEGLLAAVETRGSFLLGRQVDQKTLTQLAPLSIDPRVAASRGTLFESAVADRASQKGLQSQTTELANQINVLETRLGTLTQNKFEADRLRQDLNTAETRFASSVATLGLSRADIYAIYPPIQIAAEPTLPDEDKYVSPSPTIAVVGALAGSFLATTGLLLLWTNRKDEEMPESVDFPFRA
ncbi:MAG: hypothetical protein DCF25_20560 [Leptolyngbya foveolarum]|uniref:Uncharacterized protein n=1 Tax=Leptolyngbya foveolarum TaxID=47253 RepID=A0A2W4TVB3_9CYAN|nr:MAG: hypothetical protein DCF25_20560 [Leptolyngbya foveolarum]